MDKGPFVPRSMPAEPKETDLVSGWGDLTIRNGVLGEDDAGNDWYGSEGADCDPMRLGDGDGDGDGDVDREGEGDGEGEREERGDGERFEPIESSSESSKAS